MIYTFDVNKSTMIAAQFDFGFALLPDLPSFLLLFVMIDFDATMLQVYV